MTTLLRVYCRTSVACLYKVRLLKYRELMLRKGAESRLPDTKPRLYLREHISSKLFPHELIKKTTLGNGKDA